MKEQVWRKLKAETHSRYRNTLPQKSLENNMQEKKNKKGKIEKKKEKERIKIKKNNWIYWTNLKVTGKKKVQCQFSLWDIVEQLLHTKTIVNTILFKNYIYHPALQWLLKQYKSHRYATYTCTSSAFH